MAAYQRDGNLGAVSKRMIVSNDVEEMIAEAAKDVAANAAGGPSRANADMASRDIADKLIGKISNPNKLG